jgi:2-polyprenyl-3-methyl-5-hydroxy-6-metoxy-1,4-benzoquinol methylase
LVNNYAAAFGAQWNRYRRTQLDSYTGVPISRTRVLRCIGEENISWIKGKRVLECGCGAGRFTEVLLSLGANVVSIDLSDAVDANRENFTLNNHHHIAQADIEALPFTNGSFDMVFCLGVVQHTPNPERTIARLYEQMSPRGLLVIDHYTHTLSYYTKSAGLFRFFLKRVSAEKGMELSEKLVDWFLPVHKAVRGSRIAQMALSRISPVFSYYQAIPELPDHLQREWALLDTHDALTDWYKHHRTPNQIEKTLTSLGAIDIHCTYGGNGVEARCRKPAESSSNKRRSDQQSKPVAAETSPQCVE